MHSRHSLGFHFLPPHLPACYQLQFPYLSNGFNYCILWDNLVIESTVSEQALYKMSRNSSPVWSPNGFPSPTFLIYLISLLPSQTSFNSAPSPSWEGPASSLVSLPGHLLTIDLLGLPYPVNDPDCLLLSSHSLLFS